jgi:hypothetical protein
MHTLIVIAAVMTPAERRSREYETQPHRDNAPQ